MKIITVRTALGDVVRIATCLRILGRYRFFESIIEALRVVIVTLLGGHRKVPILRNRRCASKTISGRRCLRIGVCPSHYEISQLYRFQELRDSLWLGVVPSEEVVSDA